VAPKPKASPKTRVAPKAKAGLKARAGPETRLKKSVRRRARRIVRRRPAWLATVSVGDAVRIPAEVPNLIGRYEPKATQEGRGREGIEGIVCSIRDIATGKLVAKTSRDLSAYVLELLHSQTFRLHYASDRNTGGPRGPEDVRENPVWQRLRGALREMAAGKQLLTVSGEGMFEGPLRSLLDGWRVVKVKARQVEAIT